MEADATYNGPLRKEVKPVCKQSCRPTTQKPIVLLPFPPAEDRRGVGGEADDEEEEEWVYNISEQQCTIEKSERATRAEEK